MKVLGIVVEYNPFHNGHLYHLERAKEKVNPDFTVAVMSGNFTQRGEPTIVDKYARAEIALSLGIDIVFELPFVYATQDAGGFAFGAIGILHRSGVVTDIVFGSESSDEEFLKAIAGILHEQPWRYQEILHIKLKQGLSFPNARKEALFEYVKEKKILDPERVRNIEKSNDILGIEYVKSILRYGSKVRFHTIKRVGAEYNDGSFKGKLSSATAIRRMIKEDNFEKAKEALPEKSSEILEREFKAGRGPVFWSDLDRLFLYRFRLMDRDDFKRIYGFVEGLDKRFYEFSKKAKNIQEFIEMVKAKRFTYSRLRRMMLYVLFEVTKEFMEDVNAYGPQYIRVLGFTEKGRELLGFMKKKVSIPIITTPSMYEKFLQDEELQINEELYKKMFLYDIKASDIYSILYPSENNREGNNDFKRKILMI
ncbi:MAG: nucleotidyltransferase [Thermotogaceae bacterium]|nr:nucleotidyltransferase [Thermotogaceae bacterium]